MSDWQRKPPAPMSLPPGQIVHCPRCLKPELEVGRAGGISVRRCPSCRGQWFNLRTFVYIVSEQAKAASKVAPKTLSHLASLRRGARMEAHGSLRCPQCKDPMEHYVYEDVSGIYVDICRAHGIWLDDGEFGKILHFVSTRAAGQS